MKIYITLFGKSKDINIQNILEEYLKRTSRYQEVDFLYFKEYGDLPKFLEKISSQNRKIYLLSEYGKEYDTEKFAKNYEKDLESGVKEIYFCIGPAEGWGIEGKNFEETARNTSQNISTFSLSKLTMQHDLATLVLSEQIYRAVSIKNNLPYHKA